jgi:NADH-quinone oxidoreductase subunit J
MTVFFIIAAVVAVLATLMVLTRTNAVHALLYLIVSLMAVALVFFVIGAPFIAALEVIIYAGAIVVLFVFVVILLNLSPSELVQETKWLRWGAWVGPALLSVVLLAELAWLLSRGWLHPAAPAGTGPVQVGLVLFGPYLLGVELASMMLLAGLVGAFHIGRRARIAKGDKP